MRYRHQLLNTYIRRICFAVLMAGLSTSLGFAGINLTGGQLVLTATGTLGPDYILLSSTNLADWQPLLVTNPTAMPLQLTTPNSAEPQCYFRLQLGP